MADRTDSVEDKKRRSRKPGSGKAAGKGAGSGSKGSAAPANPAGAPARTKKPALTKDLRDFASGRPEGWNHEDWLAFLESLQSRGHDIADREAIGLALERERLDLALSAFKGVGRQRRKALVERYGNVWTLRNADAGQIAEVGNLPRPLAEQVKQGI